MRNRVLLVDDDAEMTELVAYNLKRSGFSVGTASNGIDGVTKARSIRPDLILLDIMMPELDGFAVCEILRRDKRIPRIPIVMVTAWPGELGRLAAFECGATEYVSKPFKVDALVLRVTELLASSDNIANKS